ncbi:MAG TPA: adenylate/guanylate cyclase domain-containing protein [Anaerolineales bacterium]
MPYYVTPKGLAEEIWYWYLNGKNRLGFPKEYERQMHAIRALHHVLPGDHRCLECAVPLAGVGAWIMKRFGIHPSMMTPRLCNSCESLILAEEAGAEVELSLLFADIRGSTPLAEQKGVVEYKNFIQRFYKAAAGVLIQHYALVNRLVGDQVIGLFVQRFAGADHAGVAIEAAFDVLRATGHTDPAGPWAPVGIGIHTGTAYVGAVGSRDGVNEIGVLGNPANVTARLSSAAAEGEVLISEEAAALAGITDRKLERRSLTLKGINKPVSATVMTIADQPPSNVIPLE